MFTGWDWNRNGTSNSKLLKDSKAKVGIILLTDGVNNAGFIEPETAAI
jgi:hypothetical protein